MAEKLVSFVVEARQGVETFVVPTAIKQDSQAKLGFNYMLSKPSNQASSPMTERDMYSTAVITSLYITSVNTSRDTGFPDMPFDLYIEDWTPGKTMYKNYVLSDVKAYAASVLALDKPITLSQNQCLKIYVPALVNDPSLGGNNPNPNGIYNNVTVNVTCGAVLITTE